MRQSRLFALVTAAVLCCCSITGCKDTASQPSAEKASAYKDALNHAGYTLEQVTVLSRHNIRSPLSGSGSVLGDITNHAWYDWSSGASELSLRGGVLETEMGQFFRKWLEQSGLFPENYHPDEGAVRFYANAKQRTLATAAYFWAGFLPTAAQNIESMPNTTKWIRSSRRNSPS